MAEFGYFGEKNGHNDRHGKGTMYYSSNNIYSGEWIVGRWAGQGTYTMFDGEEYSGNFKSGRFHGVGSYRFKTGSIYTGEFCFGEMKGQGTLVDQDGATYIGEFSNGKLHGLGRCVQRNGDEYYGGFRNGNREGLGKLSSQSTKEIFVGEFVNNEISGNGIKVNEMGEVMEGHFEGFNQTKGWGVHRFMCCTIAGPGQFIDNRPASDSSQMWEYALYDVLICFRAACCCNSNRNTRHFSDLFYPQYSERALSVDTVLSKVRKMSILVTDNSAKFAIPSVRSAISKGHIVPTVETVGESPLPSTEMAASTTSTDNECVSPIRFISFLNLKMRTSFPRFPDHKDITETLESIDQSKTFFIFLSHCWIAGHENAEHWRGYAHVDNKHDEKYRLVLEGVQKAWDSLAPGMPQCYLWIDYSCIDQDGDPAGELKQLMKIVQTSDCILTPIIDENYAERSATNPDRKNSGESWLHNYSAPAWNVGPYAYLSRAWCRMEMMYAANIDLRPNDDRVSLFAAGLRSAMLAGRRPHLLYGSSESAEKKPCIVLEPLQNSYFDEFKPVNGSITKESDRIKIAQLMEELEIKKVAAEYVGGKDAWGLKEGFGVFIEESGNRYDGEFNANKRSGHGRQIFANGDMYDGDWAEDKMHGSGRFDFADGRIYTGDFSEGVWHGTGRFVLNRREEYSGTFVDGELTGKGERTFSDCTVYAGEFLKGCLHGIGHMTWINGDQYFGEFRNGQRQGYGKMNWTRKRCQFIGHWESNVMTGDGLLVNDWGMVDRGEFRNGVLHGPGHRSYLCCPMAVGTFENDNPTTSVGWCVVVCCAVPALLCMAPASCCSFRNLWSASFQYNVKLLPPKYNGEAQMICAGGLHPFLEPELMDRG